MSQQVNEKENENLVSQLLNIQLSVRFILGTVSIPIGELLDITQGSIIELETKTNQPQELWVNERPIAEAKIVCVNERIAGRISNIISSRERLQKLISTSPLDTETSET